MEELLIRNAKVRDIDPCIDIRGRTRENPIDRATLNSIGINSENLRQAISQKDLVGIVCESIDEHRTGKTALAKRKEIVGFCFAEPSSGEISSLAVLPDYENKSIGKLLLNTTINTLKALGCQKLWLATSPDAEIRAHGFYRHLGWKPSGKRNTYDDEILTLAIAE